MNKKKPTADKEILLIKEYEISKESIKSVMTLLVGMAAPILSLSILILRLSFTEEENIPELFIYFVLSLINFLIAFVAYQNVQITALQMHIKSLEKQLKEIKVFRWQSQIARIWYGDSKIATAFNFMLAFPPFLILCALYFELFKSLEDSITIFF